MKTAATRTSWASVYPHLHHGYVDAVQRVTRASGFTKQAAGLMQPSATLGDLDTLVDAYLTTREVVLLAVLYLYGVAYTVRGDYLEAQANPSWIQHITLK